MTRATFAEPVTSRDSTPHASEKSTPTPDMLRASGVGRRVHTLLERLNAATQGIGRSVDYTRRVAYRRPPALYRRLQALGVRLVARGFVPETVVVLEVRGRRSGKTRSTVVVRTRHEGNDYLVALAGESEWVRNVRAAAGRAVIRHGHAQRVELVEVPRERRAPILWAYLHRPGWSSPAQEARHYFGLHPDPTVAEIESIVDRYPVFKISTPPAEASAPGQTSMRAGTYAGTAALRCQRARRERPPQEIAQGVHRLSVYGANVYFVRSGESWVLVDAAWAWGGCARIISRAAETLFGAESRPTAILLAHLHPDHDGAALELARAWACPVYVHPDELPLARAVATAHFAAIQRYGNWLDRAVIVPLMRALRRHQPDGVAAVPSLIDVLRAFDPASGVPGLPDWTCVPTPGHAPGHVAFFRARDRVLLTGDAALTVDVNTVGGCLAWARGKSPPHAFDPPRYTNWQQDRTDASLAVLAELQPRVLAPGHGAPLIGEAATRELRLLAEHACARRRTAAVAV
jgi:deazaflavin-dependent oxidoreductase (nitroreductase family)